MFDVSSRGPVEVPGWPVSVVDRGGVVEPLDCPVSEEIAVGRPVEDGSPVSDRPVTGLVEEDVCSAFDEAWEDCSVKVVCALVVESRGFPVEMNGWLIPFKVETSDRGSVEVGERSFSEEASEYLFVDESPPMLDESGTESVDERL